MRMTEVFIRLSLIIGTLILGIGFFMSFYEIGSQGVATFKYGRGSYQTVSSGNVIQCGVVCFALCLIAYFVNLYNTKADKKFWRLDRAKDLKRMERAKKREAAKKMNESENT